MTKTKIKKLTITLKNLYVDTDLDLVAIWQFLIKTDHNDIWWKWFAAWVTVDRIYNYFCQTEKKTENGTKKVSPA